MCTSGLHESRGLSWLDERLSASDEWRLCPLVLVSLMYSYTMYWRLILGCRRFMPYSGQEFSGLSKIYITASVCRAWDLRPPQLEAPHRQHLTCCLSRTEHSHSNDSNFGLCWPKCFYKALTFLVGVVVQYCSEHLWLRYLLCGPDVWCLNSGTGTISTDSCISWIFLSLQENVGVVS
jgi:hypothetical protein